MWVERPSHAWIMYKGFVFAKYQVPLELCFLRQDSEKTYLTQLMAHTQSLVRIPK